MKKNLAILTLASLLSTSISPLALAQDHCFDGGCDLPARGNVIMTAHSAEDLKETVQLTSVGAAGLSWFTYMGGFGRLFGGAKKVASVVRAGVPYVASLKVAAGVGVVTLAYTGVRAYQTYASTGTWGDWSDQLSQEVSADRAWAYNGISNGAYQAASTVYHLFLDPLPASLRDRSGLTVANFVENKNTAAISFFATAGALASATAVVNTVRGFFVVSTAKLLEQAKKTIADNEAAVAGVDAVKQERDDFQAELNIVKPQLQDLQAEYDEVMMRVNTLADGKDMKVITKGWIEANQQAAKDVYMLQDGQIVAIRKEMVDSAAPGIIDWFMGLATEDVKALFPGNAAAVQQGDNPGLEEVVEAVKPGLFQWLRSFFTAKEIIQATVENLVDGEGNDE